MQAFLTAIGLVLVIEGALLALFPVQMRQLWATAIQSPVGYLRWGGLAAAVLGVIVVYLVRGV